MFYVITSMLFLSTAIGFATAIVLLDHRRGHGFISLFSLYFAFTLIDQFIPAFAMLITGEMPSKPSWVPRFNREQTALGAIISAIGFTLVIIGYVTGYMMSSKRLATTTERTKIIYKRAQFGLILAIAVYVFSQLKVISSMGGIVEYFISMVRFRRSVFEANSTIEAQAFSTISAISRDIIMSVCAVLFSERKNLAKPRSGWFYLILGVLISMTTFFRGTVILFGLMVIASARVSMLGNVRYLSQTKNVADIRLASRIRRRFGKRMVIAATIFLVLFTGFGVARSYFGAAQWDVENYSIQAGLEKELQRFTEGAGLFSLVDIVHSFPDETPYLNGSTIYSQAVRYIPRSLIPNKPKNYGAVEITTAMGYPLTGEAVTVPGEAWANFGFAGLPLVLTLGLLLGLLTAKRNHPQLQYFYSTMGVSLILAVGWFSFTGFMSWLPSAGSVWLFFKLTSKRR